MRLFVRDWLVIFPSFGNFYSVNYSLPWLLKVSWNPEKSGIKAFFQSDQGEPLLDANNKRGEFTVNIDPDSAISAFTRGKYAMFGTEIAFYFHKKLACTLMPLLRIFQAQNERQSAG